MGRRVAEAGRSTTDVQPMGRDANTRSAAVWLLQSYVFLLAVLPGTFVIGPLGAFGSPASVIGLSSFGLWAAASLQPGVLARRVLSLRIALGLFWIPGLLSYAVMHLNARAVDEVNAADRWILFMLTWTGVVLLAAEGLRNHEEVWRVLRMVVVGAAISAFVAILQARLSIDLTQQLAKIPGLTESSPLNSVLSRDGLARPSGTAVHPIEFGCVLAMALGPALVLALHDRTWAPKRRYTALMVIATGIPLAVSRSAIVTAAIALLFWLRSASHRERVSGGVAILVLTAGMFLTTPGLLGALRTAFIDVGTDSSIATRTNDYAAVATYLRHSPLIGRGPMTFLPKYRIIDNQWLMQLLETGELGAVALLMFLLLPSFYARVVRQRSTDPFIRQIAHTMFGLSAVAIAASAMFDSMSFATMPGYFCVYLGLVAALAGLAKESGGTGEVAPTGDAYSH